MTQSFGRVVADRAQLAELRCRFGCEGPVGIYHVPRGCVCWDDPVQALCPQHVVTAESAGPITALVALTEDGKLP